MPLKLGLFQINAKYLTGQPRDKPEDDKRCVHRGGQIQQDHPQPSIATKLLMLGNTISASVTTISRRAA